MLHCYIIWQSPNRYAQTPSSLIVAGQCLITLFYCVIVQDHITVLCHNCSIILLISRSCFRVKSKVIGHSETHLIVLLVL